MKKINFMYMLVIALMFGFNAVAQNNPDNPCPGEEPQCDNSGTEFKVDDLDNKGGGDNDCEPGGLANVYCPYWKVQIEYVFTLTEQGMKITCVTGGNHACYKK